MADRKPFLSKVAVDPELKEMLDKIQGKDVSEEQLREQRVSFAYGNAPESDLITKDSVRVSSENIKLIAK